MLRKLSAALSIDRPSSARVHPAGATVADVAAAAEAAAAEAAAAEVGSINEAHDDALDALEEDSLRAAYSLQDPVTVLVQRDASEGDMPRSPATHTAAQGRAQYSTAAAAAVEQEEPPPPPPPPPTLRLPVIALAATAGSVAAAAVGDAVEQGAAGGSTPIAAVHRRGLRISFADTLSTAVLPPIAEGVKPAPLQPTGAAASHPQPRKSMPRTSLLGIPAYPARMSRRDTEGVPDDRKGSVFDLLDRKGGKPQARWRAALTSFLQSGPCLATSLLLTIMILYSDSLRQACTPKSADPYFLAFTIFVLVAFCLEAASSCLANPCYAKSFYFIVDVVSSVSILLDIPAIVDPVINSANDGNGDMQQRGGLENAAQITSSSTRAARLAQVTKWLRLFRIMKLWAFYFKHRQYIIDRRTFIEAELEASSQSRVGEKLTELTIRKVVIMVLLVMFAMPVFDLSVGYYGGPPMLDIGGLSMLHVTYGAMGNSSAFQAALEVYIADTPYRLGRGHTGDMTDLVVYNNSFISVPGGVDGLRTSEFANFTMQSGAGCTGGSGPCDVSFATYNLRWDSQIQGLLEVGRTTFIIIILLVGAIWFIADTDRLVLRPLERMVALVKEVSENPLAMAKVSQLTGKEAGKHKQEKPLETQVLESSIHKICSLLSVGFGEAGAEVIADNIKSGGDLNPMVPGRKVAAIFGFCDIRSFTDATEVLQEDVMEFVNSIAQIVHHEVHVHGGAANKNIGDAFLLVWKLPGSRRENGRSSLARTRSQGSGFSRMSRASSSARISMLMGADREPERKEEAANIADQALASFIIIQAALKRSAKLRDFCNREDLSRRLPGYQVNMGFGLHVGWAIEGAIGSEHKIDASYLSPHVNMASRLEAATKQYGASILLSDDFVRMLSPAVRALVRQVDCVTVKGSTKPVGLFTYDVDLSGLSGPLRLSQHHKSLMRLASTTSTSSVAEDAAAGAAAAAGEVMGEKAAVLAATAATTSASPSGSTFSTFSSTRQERYETFSSRKYEDEFSEHPDIVTTRGADLEFLAKFATGFEAYRSGDWAAARDVFLETLSMRQGRGGVTIEDGPSATLLRVMAGHDYRAPVSWAGFRELTEK